jgi:pimeloyl-ACP methyl ester carboxylesterase
MTRKATNILSVCLLIVSTGVSGQEPVSSNGHFANIKGLRIYYEESGKGVPIVLLHHFFATTSQWKAYIPELSKRYRVINVDLPGHGRSDYIDTTKVYLHQKAAQYIIDLIDLLKLDSVYIMGASSGAFTALYISTMRPNLVKRLIVVGGQVYYSKQTRQIISNCCKNPPDESLLFKHGNYKSLLLQKQFYNFRQLYGDPSFTPDVLATITAKALIVHGDDDGIAPVSNALEMHKHIPASHLWVVPHGGHIPPSDSKNEGDFRQRILEFLNGDWDKR